MGSITCEERIGAMEYKGMTVGMGNAEYKGKLSAMCEFIQEHQLKDEALWKKFVRVYKSAADVNDKGWRGEYWGKMMRGACMTYLYSGDEQLYLIIERAVENLLGTQDENGRISTYDMPNEFTGWDMWCRKYVMTGLEYFYEICKSKALKAKILRSLQRQADYILKKVGPGKGRIPVEQTSEWWGGLNSSTILEPFVQLYKLSGEKRYLNFAEYIIRSGGCAKGNLYRLALENRLKPYEYPVTKAYEMMSFFEGVLAYYEATREEECFFVVENFVSAVRESEITAIGGAGCTHELFDHSAVKQTEYSETIMQETCVTVTWMRLNDRMLRLTGDAKYADAVERSAYNALLGSINTEGNKQYSFEKKSLVEALPFDSYSPLYANRRGRGVGGYKEFSEGGYYGCCACIGAAGTALVPLTATLKTHEGFRSNYFLEGTVKTTVPDGCPVTLLFRSDVPAGERFSVKVKLARKSYFAFEIRMPYWAESATLSCGGETRKFAGGGYLREERDWEDGDELTVSFEAPFRIAELNGKICVSKGPLVLARDESREEEGKNIVDAVSGTEDPKICRTECIKPLRDEQLCCIITFDKAGKVRMTDYASCGRNWLEARSRVNVWLPTEAASSK